jgi:hypothetical protein
MFNFKSMMFRVPEQRVRELGLPSGAWVPQSCDYYRFVLSEPALDGILCSPLDPSEVKGLVRAMEQRPLTPQEQEYMIWLSSVAFAPRGAGGGDLIDVTGCERRPVSPPGS